MENQKQQIVYLPIDDIKPYENNPRYNEKAIADVATSIRKGCFFNTQNTRQGVRCDAQ